MFSANPEALAAPVFPAAVFPATFVPAAVPLTVVFAAAVFILQGCAFLSPDLRIRLELPCRPCPWEEAGLPVSWVLRYPGSDGDIEEIVLAPGDRCAEIRTSRGLDVPIAAYPLGRLRPAGAFVDHRVEGMERISGVRELRLRWSAGAAAELFLELWDMPERRARVDAVQLSALMTVEGGGDPWSCDLERIRSTILFGSLSTVQVAAAERRTAELTLPEGDWVCGNPLFCTDAGENGDEDAEAMEKTAGCIDSAPAEGGGFRVVFTGLYPGIHRFYSPGTEGGEELELHLHVHKNGESRCVYGPPRMFE